jgi:nitrite reductase (NO-forming)
MHKMAAAEPQAQPPTTSGAAAAPPAGGDAAAGRLVFRKCQACHSMEPGKTLLGPSLAGIVGRKAGADANYNYSPPMKQANVVWDAKSLDAYLADPQKVVPGNKMPFPGLKTEQDRADILRSSPRAAALKQQRRPGDAPAPAREATLFPMARRNRNPIKHRSPNAGVPVPDANYTLRSAASRMVSGRRRYRRKVNPI